jgi:hypothetical protein
MEVLAKYYAGSKARMSLLGGKRVILKPLGSTM